MGPIVGSYLWRLYYPAYRILGLFLGIPSYSFPLTRLTINLNTSISVPVTLPPFRTLTESQEHLGRRLYYVKDGIDGEK